jgi:hypothetical protein
LIVAHHAVLYAQIHPLATVVVVSRSRRALLILTTVAAFATVYANSIAYIQQSLFDFLITIEGVVIAELALYEILKASEETELTIKLHTKQDNQGCPPR